VYATKLILAFHKTRIKPTASTAKLNHSVNITKTASYTIASETSDRSNPSSAVMKTVRFSFNDDIKTFERLTSEEAREAWYNREDLHRSSRILARDVNLCSRLVVARRNQGQDLTEKERTVCVGLEHLLAADVRQHMHLVNDLKKRHLCIVLIEQARQKYFQDYSTEELGRVSKNNSIHERVRSHARALMIMPTMS
jgi:hypothetical protein